VVERPVVYGPRYYGPPRAYGPPPGYYHGGGRW
jgi:hypothetical protein